MKTGTEMEKERISWMPTTNEKIEEARSKLDRQLAKTGRLEQFEIETMVALGGYLVLPFKATQK